MAGGNLNERTLIADIFAPLTASTPGALNLRDDAAFLKPPAGKDLVITSDMIVAGVHFLDTDPADLIAAKALRVNLSDLAAKGAVPLGYTLSLALNDRCSYDWVKEFARGLKRDHSEFGIALYGGDTSKTPGPLSISITAFGTVANGCMVQRKGAQVGDNVYVSGTIGDGTFGLAVALADQRFSLDVLSEEQRHYLLQRYRCPQPRCNLTAAVASFASAAMDVSDGLIGDLGALLNVSGVSADIMLNDIPVSAAVKKLLAKDQQALPKALSGGDDYEIICTVAEVTSDQFEAAAKRRDVAVTKIGVITKGQQPPRFIDGEGQPVIFTSERYEH